MCCYKIVTPVGSSRVCKMSSDVTYTERLLTLHDHFMRLLHKGI